MNTSKREIMWVDPRELAPNRYNPNKHDAKSFDMLLFSLERFGFTQPIVADQTTGRIIDGEHRWRASMVMKMDSVPVIYLDLSETEMMIATVLHNRVRGGEDQEMIHLIRADLADAGLDPDDIFFDKRWDTLGGGNES